MGVEQILTHITDIGHGALLVLCLLWACVFFFSTPQTKEHTNKHLRYLIGILLSVKALGLVFKMLKWVHPGVNEIQWEMASLLIEMVTIGISVLLLTNVTQRRSVTLKLIALHLMPFILLWIVNAILYTDWIRILSYAYATVYGAVFLFLNTRAAYRYRRYIRDEFASLPALKSYRALLIVTVVSVLFVLWLLYALIQTPWMQATYYYVTAVLWFVTCVHVEHQIRNREASDKPAAWFDMSLTDFEQAMSMSHNIMEDDSERQQKEKQNANEMFLYRLRTLCEDKKLYTNDKLTRDDLAKAMNINHTYFTRMLSETTGKNFYEYINSLRMQHAEKLLRQVDYPLDQIPLDVGYTHRSTYYRIFRDTHGCTPLEWRNNQLRTD